MEAGDDSQLWKLRSTAGGALATLIAQQQGLPHGLKHDPGRRGAIVHVIVIALRQPDLLRIVAALGASGRFAGRLHGRQ